MHVAGEILFIALAGEVYESGVLLKAPEEIRWWQRNIGTTDGVAAGVE